ncbi:uncharacterized protein LOC108737596 isoform X2 [Agrilus planipennis]|nr:uncharacterized protein LOC108737596 isoform X2 [Agrilus planipennis]XP_018326034.1 uncharacterized protein LOC108737596 isoform X2 [Agrilus planipennis]
MQVATLFRESTNLLGATMEAGGSGGPESVAPNLGPTAICYDSFSHPVSVSNKYRINMKLEPQDDGYETSGDMILSNTAPLNHEVKCEKNEDPYSFIDDDPMPGLPVNNQGPPVCINSADNPSQFIMGPKKRGRKKKLKTEEINPTLSNPGLPRPVKERKKHDRFNGMPEEEVSKRTLPDHLAANLDIIIIGINPGLFAAYKGHHYAGPGNHFWKCLYLSGLTKEQMTADEDYKLLQVGIGFTNMVQRPTKGSADLTRKEIKEGSQILLEKLRKFRPKIAVFNGKLIYEVFSGKKDFHFGRQPDCVDGTNTYMWVMPSSSARCAQLPRAADKVPFYAALKKFRDYLNGLIATIDDSEMVFTEPRLKACYEPEPKPDPDITDISNAVITKEDGTIVPCKKKRGRPKKIKVEGEETPKTSTPRKPPAQTNCDFPKKKRGRPKKVKADDLKDNLQSSNIENNMKSFGNPSPIQSPNGYYHMPPDVNPPNSTNSLYVTPNYNQSPRSAQFSQSPRPPYSQSPRPPYSQSPRPQYSQSPRPPYSQSPRPQYNQSPRQYNQSPRPQYSQSPRPHSHSFTHSDLSSEISAAISSEPLGSPTSPSIGPPDFEPPSNMAEEGFESPASSPSEQPPHYPYQTSYNMDMPSENAYLPPRHSQDIASKSLSGLESLVDQIPSITEGEGDYSSPASPFSYASPSNYPIYPTPTWSNHYDSMPPLSYPQIPYAQSYASGLHVPSPNYPYYGYPQPTSTHPPGYPPYLGGF